MTYDDVADIKEALQLMVLLLERMANTLDRIQDDTKCIAEIRSDTIIIQDDVADIAHVLLRPEIPLPGDGQ